MENPLFRIGLEIETCFRGKPSEVTMGTTSCVFIQKPDTSCYEYKLDACPVSFLKTTHAPNSLFKGVPELVAYCPRGANGKPEGCPVELIINPSREIFYNGKELIDKNGSIMAEFHD